MGAARASVMDIDEGELFRTLRAFLMGAVSPGDVTTGVRQVAYGEDVVRDRLAQLMAVGIDVLRVDSVGMMLLDDSDVLRTVGSSDAVGRIIEQAQAELGLGPGYDAVRRDRTVVVSDLSEADGYRSLWQLVAPTGVRSLMAVPLRANGTTVGNLHGCLARTHTWSASEIRAGEAFAGVISSVLQIAAQPDGTR